MADDAQVQRVDDLRVGRHHALVKLGLRVDVEEAGGELADAVPLAVHEEAAAVGMDERTDPLHDLEHDPLHVDVLLHVLDQFVHDLALLELQRGRGHRERVQSLMKNGQIEWRAFWLSLPG